MRQKLVPYILGTLAIISILYATSYFYVYKPLDKRFSIFKTVPIINREKISDGYTLIAPYNRMLSDDPKQLSKIYLLDLMGNSVNTWDSQHQTLYSILKSNGNLLVTMEIPKYSQFFPPGGNTGIIQELNWNSKVVWEYKNERMHHDFVPLKNGNILVALWEKTPNNIAQNVVGGVPGSELQGVMWSDEIAEINPKGESIWSWHAYEHLDPEKDILGQLMPRYAWSFANGLAYSETNPIDGTPAILISSRSTNNVLMVRRSDGEIIWRSPKGMLSAQHDPTFLQNGNIMVFDNGFDRAPNPFPLYGSRVLEIDPRKNEIVWKFDGGEGVIDKVRFFAPLVSGAQRLPNGNTLITDGPKGHIFETTKEGEIVWDFINPYTTTQTGHFPNNFVFKSRRYSENEINFPIDIAAPLNKTTYSLYKFLSKIYPQ